MSRSGDLNTHVYCDQVNVLCSLRHNHSLRDYLCPHVSPVKSRYTKMDIFPDTKKHLYTQQTDLLSQHYLTALLTFLCVIILLTQHQEQVTPSVPQDLIIISLTDQDIVRCREPEEPVQ